MKRARGIHGVLSGHRVDDEQRLGGAHERVQRLRLGHHFGVDVQAARGVEDQPTLAAPLRRLDRLCCNGPGELCVGAKVAAPIVGRELRELFARCRPIDIGAHEQHCAAVLLVRLRASFAAVVVLPAPWRPTSMMTAGRPCGAIGRESPPSTATSSSCTIFTNAWPGIQAARDFLAQRAIAHAVDERFRNGQRDVRLEQGHTNRAHRLAHVVLGDPAAPRDALQGGREARAELIEHE